MHNSFVMILEKIDRVISTVLYMAISNHLYDQGVVCLLYIYIYIYICHNENILLEHRLAEQKTADTITSSDTWMIIPVHFYITVTS